MLCVWWDYEGIIHFELLEKNQTVDAVQQMERVKMAIQEKRPNRLHRVLLLLDNARPHIAKRTKEAIEGYGWEVLPHPPYSPDLAPTDFHPFRSLSNAMRGVSFNNDAELKTCLDGFFGSKTKDFYRQGIEKLVERWGKVIDTNGEYIVD